MTAEQHFDVVVVGGGMVGSSFACALAGSGLQVAVIESAALPTWSEQQFDQRVSAITRASQQFLRHTGIWKRMKGRRISAFREMHVWDATGSGEIHFDSAEIGEPDMGHIVENSVIQLCAHEQLTELDNVTYIGPVKVQTATVENDAVKIMLEDERQIQAQLLVGADGGNSWVRRNAGIDVRGWAYDQKAVVTTAKTALPHRQTAWQRFLPTGPLAFLPLTDGYSSIVWSATLERADDLLAMDDTMFMAELERAFESRLGKIESVSPRASFPLRLQHATSYLAERTVLIGDAAHTIHPLAGQGVNLGFMDAAALAQVLTETAAKTSTGRSDIGARNVLRRYERWRKADNLGMMTSMDVFKKLFGNDQALLRWSRNAGLSVTDKLVPVKNRIMRHTMGLTGDLPQLAKMLPQANQERNPDWQ